MSLGDNNVPFSPDQEWAIREIVELRSKYLAFTPDYTNCVTVGDRVRAEFIHSMNTAEVLSRIGKILDKYILPDRHGSVQIKHLGYYSKYSWIPRSTYNLEWGPDLTGNAEKVQTYFIDHFSDFLQIVHESYDEKEKGELAKYTELKKEVEAYIERFKAILVSDEFL